MWSTAAKTPASITAWASVNGMVIARKGPGRRSANDDPSAAHRVRRRIAPAGVEEQPRRREDRGQQVLDPVDAQRRRRRPLAGQHADNRNRVHAEQFGQPDPERLDIAGDRACHDQRACGALLARRRRLAGRAPGRRGARPRARRRRADRRAAAPARLSGALVDPQRLAGRRPPGGVADRRRPPGRALRLDQPGRGVDEAAEPRGVSDPAGRSGWTPARNSVSDAQHVADRRRRPAGRAAPRRSAAARPRRAAPAPRRDRTPDRPGRGRARPAADAARGRASRRNSATGTSKATATQAAVSMRIRIARGGRCQRSPWR